MHVICSRTGTARYSLACNTLFFAALFTSAAPALGQGLPSLTVTALSMTSERTAVPAGRTFHVTIHLHTAQRATDLSWLVLPDVTNLTILGDEKHTTQTPNGTDYVEVLSVAAIAPGEATLSPAYLDARDPSRGGKPFRFSSNALRIAVTGDVALQPSVNWHAVWAVAGRVAGGFALAIVLLLAIVVAGRRTLRRKEYVILPTARPVQASPATPVDRFARARDAARRLAAQPDRARSAELRSALFSAAEARPDETLASLLERVPASEATLRAALRTAERATFVDEVNLQGAIEDLLDAVRRMGLL